MEIKIAKNGETAAAQAGGGRGARGAGRERGSRSGRWGFMIGFDAEVMARARAAAVALAAVASKASNRRLILVAITSAPSPIMQTPLDRSASLALGLRRARLGRRPPCAAASRRSGLEPPRRGRDEAGWATRATRGDAW